MGGLGHYLEQEGVPTTHISLIRLHTEKIKPPRALWVPFELGRPFGLPNDPAFQTKVLKAVLGLLEAPSGPVLEDFPEDAPVDKSPKDDGDGEGMVCPISFPPGPPDDSLRAALMRELGQMEPWYERAVELRGGRSLFGVSGLNIDRVAGYILAFVEGETPASPNPDIGATQMLKLACDDLKAYYLNAVTAQPGFGTNAASANWFWDETTAGQVLATLRERLSGSTDETLKALATVFLVPRSELARKGKNPFPKS